MYIGEIIMNVNFKKMDIIVERWDLDRIVFFYVVLINKYSVDVYMYFMESILVMVKYCE